MDLEESAVRGYVREMGNRQIQARAFSRKNEFDSTMRLAALRICDSNWSGQVFFGRQATIDTDDQDNPTSESIQVQVGDHRPDDISDRAISLE